MPARSAVEMLPDEIQKQLDAKLQHQNFANYRQLSAWLQEQGFEISTSAVHRYGQKFEDRCKAISAARRATTAIVEANPDDKNAMNEALTMLVQEKLFTVLVEAEGSDIIDALPALGRTVAELGKASIQQKKYAAEVRSRTEKAAEESVAIAKKGGLSDEAAAAIRRHILGIAK